MWARYATHYQPSTFEVGSRVRADGDGTRGAVGAFVSSAHSDRLLAITTGAVMNGAPNTPILLADEERVVGRTIALATDFDEPGGMPAWRMLGLFMVDVPIEMTTVFGQSHVDDPSACLGKTVLRQNGQVHRGRVTAIDVPIHLRTAGTIVTHYFTGLVEVTSEPGSSFADGSSGGQGVYRENGELLGLIVGGADDRCFVAPIEGLMRRHNLVMADAVAFTRHNDLLGVGAGVAAVGTANHYGIPPDRSQRFEALNDFMRTIPNVPLFYLSSRHDA